MAGARIELRNVTRRFQLGSEEIWAVRDISLSVEPGEFLALIGRSGSGKTTLLNTIAGLDRPTSGEVEIDGERVDTMRESELISLRRQKLGFIFQSFGLLPLLSAQENVELPLRIAGVHRARPARAREVLELVGLERRAHHRPTSSPGASSSASPSPAPWSPSPRSCWPTSPRASSTRPPPPPSSPSSATSAASAASPSSPARTIAL